MGDRKVILIKGDYSKWYDEIIFIVKNNTAVPQSPAEEAERIIRNYIASKYEKGISVKKVTDENNAKKRHRNKTDKKKNFYINKVIDVCLILVLIALAVLVFIMVS